MIKFLGIGFCIIPFCTFAIFDHDRAIVSAQKNDFKKSQELLTRLVVDHPENADLLYDLGVSAYKNNEFQTALSYFNKAANIHNAPASLIEQATFNTGNAHVHLKQLHEAIAAYDRVLEKNPEHEKARENKEMVKKMLEQQQNQDKQNKKEQQNQQSNKENNEQNNSDSKNKNQDKDKKNDSKEKSDQNDQQSSSDNAQDKSGKENPHNRSANEGDEQKEQHQSPHDKENKNRSQQKQDAHNGQQQNKTQSSFDHSDEKGNDPGNSAPAGQPQNTDHKTKNGQLPVGLARLLNEQEKKDAQLNKQMTKALVANQGGGKNDYNCW